METYNEKSREPINMGCACLTSANGESLSWKQYDNTVLR